MTATKELELYSGINSPKEPLVSVCIANYNGAEYIEQCIRSVLSQERDYEIEIILHDDASTDESLQIIRTQFPQVEVLASKENVGFCISNNRMVAHSRGDYVLLLNNDAVLRPESLKAFIDYAVTQPIQGILGLPQYTLYDGSLVDRGYEFDLFMNPIPVFAEGPTEVSTVTGACLWIPRNVWDNIGGFPTGSNPSPRTFFFVVQPDYSATLSRYSRNPGLIIGSARTLGAGRSFTRNCLRRCEDAH